MLYRTRVGLASLDLLRLCKIDPLHQPSQFGNGLPQSDRKQSLLQFCFVSQSPNLPNQSAYGINQNGEIINLMIHLKPKEFKMSKAPLYVAGTIFAIVALVHLYRLYSHFNLIVGSTPVPFYFNIVGAIIFGALSLWMFKAACPRCCKK
jgi:hypothetical protein